MSANEQLVGIRRDSASAAATAQSLGRQTLVLTTILTVALGGMLVYVTSQGLGWERFLLAPAYLGAFVVLGLRLGSRLGRAVSRQAAQLRLQRELDEFIVKLMAGFVGALLATLAIYCLPLALGAVHHS